MKRQIDKLTERDIQVQSQLVIRRGIIYHIRKPWDRSEYSAAFIILRVNLKSVRIKHLTKDLSPWPRLGNEETITLDKFRRCIRFWKLDKRVAKQVIKEWEV